MSIIEETSIWREIIDSVADISEAMEQIARLSAQIDKDTLRQLRSDVFRITGIPNIILDADAPTSGAATEMLTKISYGYGTLPASFGRTTVVAPPRKMEVIRKGKWIA